MRIPLPSVTPWSARNAVSAASIAAAALVVTTLITALSDEGNVRWSVRIARAIPAAPLCAAIGAWAAARSCRLRGELRALESLGCSPWECARAPFAGAAAVGVCAAALVLVSPDEALVAFFPSPAQRSRITLVDSQFVDVAAQHRFEANGEIASIADVEVATQVGVRTAFVDAWTDAPRQRVWAAVGIALAAIAFALTAIVTIYDRLRTSLALLAVTTSLAIVAFDAAALGLAPPSFVAVPPLMLLISEAIRYRLASCSFPKSTA